MAERNSGGAWTKTNGGLELVAGTGELPIGSVVYTETSDDPAITLGYGTWELIAEPPP